MDLSYHEIYQNYKSPINFRFEMVKYALKNGIKPASRQFQTTVKTVKKWVKRYKRNLNSSSLKDKSKARKTQKNEITKHWKARIIQYANRAITNNKRLKAAYIKRDLKVPYSLNTVIKVLRTEGFWKRKKPKKTERKKDLRAIKSNLKAFEKIQIDIKYLDDIPEYFHDYIRYKLPRYQITARDVKTGALFVGWAREKTVTNTCLFLNYLLDHLEKQGVDLKQITVQTDNGKEFYAGFESLANSAFTKLVKARCKDHKLIPPGAKTWQSDVETSHNLIENEFYSVGYFEGENDVLKQLKTYVYWFNCKRFNAYKGGSPKDFLDDNFTPSVLKLDPIIADNRIFDLQNVNNFISST